MVLVAARRSVGRYGWADAPSRGRGLADAARLGALAAGRYAVLIFPHGAWPAITGILVQAERSGMAACGADPWWEFMMTAQFICTRKEILAGVRFTVWAPDGVPRGMPVLVRLRRGIVTYGPK